MNLKMLSHFNETWECRADFHTHTVFSDGHDTAEEMVRSAIACGMTSIGISDHSCISFDDSWTLTSDTIAAYRDEVERLKEKYSGQIDIYCGIELDLYSVGSDIASWSKSDALNAAAAECKSNPVSDNAAERKSDSVSDNASKFKSSHASGKMPRKADAANAAGAANVSHGFDYIIAAVHYTKHNGIYCPVDDSVEKFAAAIKDVYDGDVYAFAEDYYENVADLVDIIRIVREPYDVITDADNSVDGISHSRMYEPEETVSHDDLLTSDAVHKSSRIPVIIAHFDLFSKFNEGNRFFDPENERYRAAWKRAADRLLNAGLCSRSQSDFEAGAETGQEIEPGNKLGAGPETEIESVTESETGPETGIELETEPGKGSKTDTDPKADPEAGAVRKSEICSMKFPVFEINTGAMSRGYRSEPYPSAEMIEYISSRGGQFILSSDSHSRENLCFGFETLRKQLRQV